MDDVKRSGGESAGPAPAGGRYAAPAGAPQGAAPHGPRQPLPGPDDDVRPPMGLDPQARGYLQGDKLPATSSVLISNSKYLNNPYYREAYATQALRRHGHDLPTTYMVPYMTRAIEEVTDWARMAQLLAEEKGKNPEFGAWIDARRYTVFTKENTATYGPGTFGRVIHEFLQIPGMDMEFISRAKPAESDLEYMIKRISAAHDLEHMVTGFGPNTAGENALAMMGVVASARYFTPEFAQMKTQSQVWITSTGYNRTALHYHHALPTYLDAMSQGIRAGMAVKKPLFMTQWEEYLDWPLEDIAADLGFERGPGDEWAWTTEAACG